MRLGEQAADGVITALSQRLPSHAAISQVIEKTLVFSGSDYSEAIKNMDKYFLQRCWSDGLPLVPPTPEATNQMLEGTDVPRDHVVAVVEPGGGKATIEKIAINAVMAGCLPQNMPVIIAAVEAITDSRFDLITIQSTAGPVSPLLIASGPELIKQLNINDGFGTIGPGWQANTTIGRAIRLIMINIGYGWPGTTDIKPFGTPFKFVTLMAENESGYRGAWEPLRVAEGFDYNQATVSVTPAYSWQPDHIQENVCSARKVLERISQQGRVMFDRIAHRWGKDHLVIIDPSTFDVLHKEGLSRLDCQKALYDLIQVPCFEFYELELADGKGPVAQAGAVQIPEWIVQRCREDSNALVPLLLKPESIKIVVAGGPAVATIAFVGSWGAQTYFITKPIRLPKNWAKLLAKYSGWETPIVK